MNQFVQSQVRQLLVAIDLVAQAWRNKKAIRVKKRKFNLGRAFGMDISRFYLGLVSPLLAILDNVLGTPMIIETALMGLLFLLSGYQIYRRQKKPNKRKARTYHQLVKAGQELVERTKDPHMREKIATALSGWSVNH